MCHLVTYLGWGLRHKTTIESIGEKNAKNENRSWAWWLLILNPSTWESEAGELLRCLSQPVLYNKFQASLGYRVRPRFEPKFKLSE